MTDTFDTAKRSSIMRAIKSQDTTPELFVRRQIYAMGFRYRIHVKNLPGCPDLVFARLKTVVFVNGCFWHWHGCPRARLPKTNTTYWREKLNRTMHRDKRNYDLLSSEGWTVIIIWDCDLEAGVQSLASHLQSMR